MAELQTENRFNAADCLPAFFTLVVGAVFGGSLIFLTPPFHVPEEGQHFSRSYALSQGIIYASRNGNSVGAELPASLEEADDVSISHPQNEYAFHASVEKLKEGLQIPLDPQRRKFYEFPVTARYSPAPYVPAAIALGLGRYAGLSALEELYAGRIGTLVAYLLLVTAAVWLMPIQKWTLTLIALMPMSIFLAAGITADALSIAAALLAIAMILRLALREKSVDRQSLCWLGATLLVVALAKPGYVLIVLLFLLVSKNKFSDSWRCWRARAWMVGLPLAVSLAWVLSIRGLCVPLRPSVDLKAQADWILSNPWMYLKMMDTRINDPYLHLGIIAMLGWGTIILAPIVYKIYWLGLLMTTVFDGGPEHVRLPKLTRAVAVILYFLVMAVIATLTYLTWHAVGDRIIHGLQTRYSIPVLPLLLLPLRSSAKVASSRFSRGFAAIVAIVVVLIGAGATWQAMIARYYWHGGL
jgi:uncharacterized membrane protein